MTWHAIAVTLGLASATAREFYKVDAFAGKILIPYLLWLAFANALNYSIWQKNPGVCSHTLLLPPLALFDVYCT